MSKTTEKPPTVRCAVYTRKSTEDGLEQEFNTLDAQRESAEKYIGSVSDDGRSLPSAVRIDASLSADSHRRSMGPR